MSCLEGETHKVVDLEVRTLIVVGFVWFARYCFINNIPCINSTLEVIDCLWNIIFYELFNFRRLSFSLNPLWSVVALSFVGPQQNMTSKLHIVSFSKRSEGLTIWKVHPILVFCYVRCFTLVSCSDQIILSSSYLTILILALKIIQPQRHSHINTKALRSFSKCLICCC